MVTFIWGCGSANKEKPPLVKINNYEITKEEFEEVRTRIKYFSPGGGTSLFPSSGSFFETLMNPHSVETLRLLRQKSGKPLRITTNGRSLTPNLVTQLSHFKPIYLYISLNSCSSSRRNELMKDTRPEIAIKSLALLRTYASKRTLLIVF